MGLRFDTTGGALVEGRSPLALRAVKGRAVALHDASHHTPTSRFHARLTFPPVHLEIMGKVPHRTVHGGKIVQGGTTRRDGLLQHRLDARRQADQGSDSGGSSKEFEIIDNKDD